MGLPTAEKFEAIQLPLMQELIRHHPTYGSVSQQACAQLIHNTLADNGWSSSISMHALGLAFDINPQQNPYIRFTDEETIVSPKGALWAPKERGTLSQDHPLVRFMGRLGWEWGGIWTPSGGRVDYQHFQKTTKD